MVPDDTDELRQLIRKHALQNALKYDAPPRLGAVVGKLMGERADLKARAGELNELVEEELRLVAGMSRTGMEKELQRILPVEESKGKETSEKQKSILPVLPESPIGGEVVMRFAPNPNGPPTLGSARGIIVNHEYAVMNDGKFILRFDDTDPQTKKPLPEAYDWYYEDCIWLGAAPDKVVVSSERIPVYYEYAEKLMDMGAAYVCECSQQEFKKFKDAGRSCPHHAREPEDTREKWKRMLDGGYKPGEAVLRIKTQADHPNPAIRDWVAFRIIDAPHPRVGCLYRVWPMLDFESAVEDHLQGITHITRGKDLRDSEWRQRYVYDYLGWTYPAVVLWGRLKVHEFGRLGTSWMSREIQDGVYSGWDDPRLPTIRAFKRRGFMPEAIRKFMLDLGMGENDISLSLKNLYAENRKQIDSVANRYFFAWNPAGLKIENNPRDSTEAPLHPERSEMRTIHVTDELFICGDDADKLGVGDELRLKNLYNIRIKGVNPLRAEHIGDGVEDAKGKPIIQWVSTDGIHVWVLTPDGDVKGIGEPLVAREIGSVVQFERYAFVRIDQKIRHAGEDVIIAYYTHK